MKKFKLVLFVFMLFLPVKLRAQEGIVLPTPLIIQKANNNVGGSSVKTLSTTVSATTGGNSLIVAVGAGEVVGSNIVLTVTDTKSDTCNLIVTQAVSTTFAGSIYHCPNIIAGSTAVTATFSGSSSTNTTLAMEVWEVYVPQGQALIYVPDQFNSGTATSTAPNSGSAMTSVPSEFGFGMFGVGTAAQTVTVTGTGTWNNDSGQINPASASGLFSFVATSQLFATPQNETLAGTITSEPWVALTATFKSTLITSTRMVCGNSYVQNAFSSTGNTQIAALVTNRSIAVCLFAVNGASTTATTVKLTSGTGSNCGTGTADLTTEAIIQAQSSVSPIGMILVIPPNSLLTTPVGTALCLNNSAAQAVNVQVLWGYL